MEDKRSNAAPLLLGVVILLAVSLAGYVGGYFLRDARRRDHDNSGVVVRQYPSMFECMIFQPAARLDGQLREE
jgi:hypothetical protein